MFDFGDEFTVESYRIPWLIWIQLLVLLLLLALLYCFSIVALDLSPSGEASAAAGNDSSSTGRGFVFNSPATVIINRRQNTQGGENTSVKGEIATSVSRRSVCGDEFTDGEESSSVYFHPCHYFNCAGRKRNGVQCTPTLLFPETNGESHFQIARVLKEMKTLLRKLQRQQLHQLEGGQVNGASS